MAFSRPASRIPLPHPRQTASVTFHQVNKYLCPQTPTNRGALQAVDAERNSRGGDEGNCGAGRVALSECRVAGEDGRARRRSGGHAPGGAGSGVTGGHDAGAAGLAHAVSDDARLGGWDGGQGGDGGESVGWEHFDKDFEVISNEIDFDLLIDGG